MLEPFHLGNFEELMITGLVDVGHTWEQSGDVPCLSEAGEACDQALWSYEEVFRSVLWYLQHAPQRPVILAELTSTMTVAALLLSLWQIASEFCLVQTSD